MAGLYLLPCAYKTSALKVKSVPPDLTLSADDLFYHEVAVTLERTNNKSHYSLP